MTKPNLIRTAVLAALLLGGCAAVGPDYRAPQMELPEAWPAQDASGQVGLPTPLSAVNVRWWTLYGDPVLERLEDEALAYNTDMQLAAARVLEARAQAGITAADQAPVVFASAAASRDQSSLEGSMPLPSGTPRTSNNYRVAVNVSYELDFWGKYRRASEAARADLLALESARQSLRLTLTAQIAQQYFALLAVDAEVATLQRTVEAYSETLELLRRRVTAGITSEYSVHQQEAEVAAARSRLAAAVQRQEMQETALTALLGRSPRQIMTGSVARGAPQAMPVVQVPAGLPSELLLRRPDVLEAEQQLMAANARIGVARAQVFPALALTGFLGSESTAFSNLFSGPAGIYQFAAAVTQPIFNAGRTRYGSELAEARHEQMLVQYKRAVANAFADVRQALATQRAASEVLAAESERVAALKSARHQATLRFEAGLSSRLEVLEVERQLLQAELARIDAERAQRAALAGLFKALGGGWSVETVQSSQ